MAAWIRFCNEIGTWILGALVAVGAFGLFDRIAGEESPIASSIGAIVVAGWTLSMVGGGFGIAYAVTTVRRPLNFWRSPYPWIIGIVLIFVEHLWWTAERASAIEVTAVVSLFLALLFVRMRWHLLAGSHLVVGSLPIVLSVAAGRDLALFNPLLASALLMAGMAGASWWLERAKQTS